LLRLLAVRVGLRLLRLRLLTVGIGLLRLLAVRVGLRLLCLRLLTVGIGLLRLLAVRIGLRLGRWRSEALLLRRREALLRWTGALGLTRWLCAGHALLLRLLLPGDDGSGVAKHRLGWLPTTGRAGLHRWHRSAARSAGRRVRQNGRAAVRA
jgi:hypothetical protein